MSGECEKCGEHALECQCRVFTHLNPKVKSLYDGIDPPAQIPPCRFINIHGRKEHEAIIKDPVKCQELGVDQYYEIMVYLQRWGAWLDTPN